MKRPSYELFEKFILSSDPKKDQVRLYLGELKINESNALGASEAILKSHGERINPYAKEIALHNESIAKTYNEARQLFVKEFPEYEFINQYVEEALSKDSD